MLVAGNWKMHKLAGEARDLAAELCSRLSNIAAPTSVLLCPPFTALSEVAGALAGTPLLLGGQNMHWEEKGAYTGEVSAQMLKDVGCDQVIIGHSERRQLFGETDETVSKKVQAALGAGLKVIMCVGETEQQREAGETESVIIGQVRGGLTDLSPDQMSDIIIAYEPVWAIGTGKNATPKQAQDVHELIRNLVADIFGKPVGESLLILYGGSVKPDNADELMTQPDINGALVGGASLDADSFEKIVRAGIAAGSE
jgi:triosephosphate isomerase